ncbi:hypothetical protein L6452_40645 [Arctium lappa]|uniref:Uncharacterized protein n=1 Tax=Arctium lappa TaxID=4217 RepID=A0ACB8XNL8_ARCLA|nr:hypothetical protein L6452_40645 [Arctium lappa]
MASSMRLKKTLTRTFIKKSGSLPFPPPSLPLVSRSSSSSLDYLSLPGGEATTGGLGILFTSFYSGRN